MKGERILYHDTLYFILYNDTLYFILYSDTLYFILYHDMLYFILYNDTLYFILYNDTLYYILYHGTLSPILYYTIILTRPVILSDHCQSNYHPRELYQNLDYYTYLHNTLYSATYCLVIPCVAEFEASQLSMIIFNSAFSHGSVSSLQSVAP